MTMQPEPLTPEQAREKYAGRFDTVCRAAEAAAFALWTYCGVTEERYVVWRDGLFCPVAHLLPDEVVLATYGPKERL